MVETAVDLSLSVFLIGLEIKRCLLGKHAYLCRPAVPQVLACETALSDIVYRLLGAPDTRVPVMVTIEGCWSSQKVCEVGTA